MPIAGGPRRNRRFSRPSHSGRPVRGAARRHGRAAAGAAVAVVAVVAVVAAPREPARDRAEGAVVGVEDVPGGRGRVG